MAVKKGNHLMAISLMLEWQSFASSKKIIDFFIRELCVAGFVTLKDFFLTTTEYCGKKVSGLQTLLICGAAQSLMILFNDIVEPADMHTLLTTPLNGINGLQLISLYNDELYRYCVGKLKSIKEDTVELCMGQAIDSAEFYNEGLDLVHFSDKSWATTLSN